MRPYDDEKILDVFNRERVRLRGTHLQPFEVGRIRRGERNADFLIAYDILLSGRSAVEIRANSLDDALIQATQKAVLVVSEEAFD